MTSSHMTSFKHPLPSLSLLFAAYLVFGKFLIDTDESWTALGIAIVWTFILALMFMRPLTALRQLIQNWFESDAVAFTTLFGMAAFASILLNWFKLFLPVFLILAAESLARLDMQTAGYRESSACILLMLTSWLGLATGWAIGQIL
jgi:hypothetical protein